MKMTKKITYIQAIESLNGSTNCTIKNDDLDNIIWIGETPNITKQQILDEQARLQAIEDAKPENTLKASAKAKLMSGEALTEDEANTIVI